MQLECLTIVFVDIKDYTAKTSDQSRGANQRLLARFAGVVKPLVRSFNGTVVKGMGDAYLITFKSPTDSLLCAMAVQDQLANRNRHVAAEERFELRFAINVGEVRIDKTDIFGEAVNITARIESLAEGGEIFFTEAVFLMMNKSEIPFQVVGCHTLKGILEEVLIYRVPKLCEGAYKLALAADTLGDRPDAALQALPFGGLALRKVHARITGQGMAPDGSFHMNGALHEIHYSAGSQSRHFADRQWWRKPLAPLVYLGVLGGGLARLASSARTREGVIRKVGETLKHLWSSSEYRQPALAAILTMSLALGFGYMGWRNSVMAHQAIQQSQAMDKQAVDQGLALKKQAKVLKDYKAKQRKSSAARAKVRKAEAEQEVATEKAKKKKGFLW